MRPLAAPTVPAWIKRGCKLNSRGGSDDSRLREEVCGDAWHSALGSPHLVERQGASCQVTVCRACGPLWLRLRLRGNLAPGLLRLVPKELLTERLKAMLLRLPLAAEALHELCRALHAACWPQHCPRRRE